MGIVDQKFYQLKNKERNSTIVKLSDTKLVRLSEMTRGRIQAAVITVNGMNVSESTPYIIKEGKGRYGRSMIALSSSKIIATFTLDTKPQQTFICILSVSGNKVLVDRCYTHDKGGIILERKFGNMIWYKNSSAWTLGTVEITNNGIMLHEVSAERGDKMQISEDEFICFQKHYSKQFVVLKLSCNSHACV